MLRRCSRWEPHQFCGRRRQQRSSRECDAGRHRSGHHAPIISCNAPAAILPSDAPVTFTASATDAWDVSGRSRDQLQLLLGEAERSRQQERILRRHLLGRLRHESQFWGSETVQWTVTFADARGNASTKSCPASVVNVKRRPEKSEGTRFRRGRFCSWSSHWFA